VKVIDLLNKIANGEEVPKKIKVGMFELTLSDDGKHYTGETLTILNNIYGMHSLNDEIEIIEEDNPIEELLIEQDCPSSNYYIRNEFGTKCGLTKHSKMIAEKVNEIAREVNKLKKESDM